MVSADDTDFFFHHLWMNRISECVDTSFTGKIKVSFLPLSGSNEVIDMQDLKSIPWQKLLQPYKKSDWRKAWIQVANTIPPFLVLWVLTVWSVKISLWLTIPLAILTAGFMMRTFILFHDAGHGSFFPSQRANEILGFITGILTFTPSYRWWHEHAIHHATAGDLDRRGTGDVLTLTVEEYLALPWYRKVGYRIMRNPFILFTIGSFLVFTVFHRFFKASDGRREKWSVVWTNLGLVGWAALWIWLFDWKAYLIAEALMLAVASSVGVWLFYVQHNFPGSYWMRHEEWDFFRAALQGSSFYKLPPVLQWISGNIGFHHIHHLSPKVPNYHLPQCHFSNPVFQVKPLTIKESLRCLQLRLWDEQSRQMVGWKVLKRYKLKLA